MKAIEILSPVVRTRSRKFLGVNKRRVTNDRYVHAVPGKHGHKVRESLPIDVLPALAKALHNAEKAWSGYLER